MYTFSNGTREEGSLCNASNVPLYHKLWWSELSPKPCQRGFQEHSLESAGEISSSRIAVSKIWDRDESFCVIANFRKDENFEN